MLSCLQTCSDDKKGSNSIKGGDLHVFGVEVRPCGLPDDFEAGGEL